MTKSIFAGLNLDIGNYKKLETVGVNHLILSAHNIDKEKWKLIKGLNCKVGISIDCFGKDGCPLDPQSFEKLETKIKNALSWKPDEIWLDHFRFDGRWESVDTGKDNFSTYEDAHEPCSWCEGRKRGVELAQIARKVRLLIPEEMRMGYFAVPFTLDPVTRLVEELGQDHRLLSETFDIVSPMLYYRMIGKSVDYIHQYVKYLDGIIKKKILPIIQIKDMPDDLKDNLTRLEFTKAFKESVKHPSSGASIFIWEHALARNKIDWIKKVFSN